MTRSILSVACIALSLWAWVFCCARTSAQDDAFVCALVLGTFTAVVLLSATTRAAYRTGAFILSVSLALIFSMVWVVKAASPGGVSFVEHFALLAVALCGVFWGPYWLPVFEREGYSPAEPPSA
jgi:hypothetical protein